MDSSADSVCEMLKAIRKENPEREIILVLDNFPSHKARDTKELACRLDIHLVYLPRYCPELNPIEYLWKSLKHVVSSVVVPSKSVFIREIRDVFYSLSPKVSFAEKWIEDHLPVKKLTKTM